MLVVDDQQRRRSRRVGLETAQRHPPRLVEFSDLLGRKPPPTLNPNRIR